MLRYLPVVFAASAALGACGPAAPTATGPTLQPEMMVKAVHGAPVLACTSKADLNAAMLHLSRKEQTKFEGMFVDGVCTDADAGRTYKVLAVDGDLVEFVDSASAATNGMWAATESFVPTR